MRPFRRFLRWVLGPIHRFLLRRVTVDDPWEAVTSLFVRPTLFGPGSTRQFSWYFEGSSSVVVTSVADVCAWLAKAEYVSDPELFNERDFWQHPKTFEHLRKGDCEDHALWGWRKIAELGLQPQLFVGQWRAERPDAGMHAWVVYRQDGRRYLLEPVIKEPAGMVRPLEDVQMEYQPHFSVEADGRMNAYGGYLLYLKKRQGRLAVEAISL